MLAQQITGMLLILDNSDIMQLLSSKENFISKATEMAALLEVAGLEQRSATLETRISGTEMELVKDLI